MPQLSPLNWIFLFLLAWSSIFLVFSMIWWSGKIDFSVSLEGNAPSEKKNIPEKYWPW